MVYLATSGRLHGRHLDFSVTSSLSETVSPNFTKFDRIVLNTLGHIPTKHDVINYFLSAADAILKSILCQE
jgi:DNA primase